MGVFRDQMRAGRAQLHEAMSEPALYFKPPYEEGVTEVLEITVRIHDKWRALGDLKGTNFNYAEIEAIVPQIIFWRSEVTPARGYVVSVESGLAYRIDNVIPHDDLTQTANVVRLQANETTAFPVPEV
jgi:hypothetical protein